MPRRAPRTLFASIDGEGTAQSAAAWLLEQCPGRRHGLLIEVGDGEPRSATVVGSAAAGRLAEALSAVEAPEGVAAEAVVRGRICWLRLAPQAPDELDLPPALGEFVLGLVDAAPADVPVAVATGPDVYRDVIECLSERIEGCSVVTEEIEAPLMELLRDEAAELGLELGAVAPPGRIAGALAAAGVGRGRAAARPEDGESGQAMPLVLGAVFVVAVVVAGLVAVAGALNGKARAQSAADLAALSAARSMKEDLPRLLSPPRLPNGLPNPAHMSKATYLARASATAIRIGTSNGASRRTLRVSFPDRASFAPTRARVLVTATARAGGAVITRAEQSAEAEIAVLPSLGSVPSMASGGGYSGPLAERQGQGMRPDVAAAFDLMSAAAASAGVSLVINSAFRSDAEQAALFAANPDPTWVAPPGQSLHRCATELDIGPPSAYGWLAANAPRFGFVQRYSWEPWHYGFEDGPAPCSREADATGGMDDGAEVASARLPSFVPERFRAPIMAAAAKWNVSAALLAAQLYAESNFDPDAGSPAGAQGIAQFMPSTAAAYGLSDPFDPEAAIDAQAHLMSDLLKQFGSPALALAAYNAGPGAVAPCGCVPDYPETQAYVAKIMALVGGAAAVAGGGMEIRLVD